MRNPRYDFDVPLKISVELSLKCTPNSGLGLVSLSPILCVQCTSTLGLEIPNLGILDLTDNTGADN